MRQGLAAAALAAALAAGGCGRVPVKAYDGPSRPYEQLSHLQGGASGDEMSARSTVEFPSIDGVRRPGTVYVASVLPGSRRIGLKQTLQFGPLTRLQFCTFALEAAAGCQYTPIPPSPPPSSVAGMGDDFRWSVELPVNIECGGGVMYMMRIDARCASVDKLFGERPPQ